MMIFIEIYSQIHIFSEFRSKKRAKTTNKDTIAIKRKKGRSYGLIIGLGLLYHHIIYL